MAAMQQPSTKTSHDLSVLSASGGRPLLVSPVLDALSDATNGDTQSKAVDVMLQHIHSFPFQNRSMSELDSITTTLIELRNTIVPRLASEAYEREYDERCHAYLDGLSSLSLCRRRYHLLHGRRMDTMLQ